MNDLEFHYDRIKYTFALSSPSDDLIDYVREVAEVLSTLTGGLTIRPTTGVWRSDGNGDAPYVGDLEVEDGYEISFLTGVGEPDLPTFKNIFREVQSELGTPIEWISTEVTPVYADHFKASIPAIPDERGNTTGDSMSRKPELDV